MSYGGILCNSMGEVKGVFVGPLCGFSTPHEAEAMAVREALSWIYRLGGNMLSWNRIVLRWCKQFWIKSHILLILMEL